MHQDFRLTFNLTKTYKADEDHAYIEGIASGTEVDLTGERMSVEALKSMVESLKSGLVEFRSEHSHEWDASIGEIIELSLNNDNKLVYKAKLDLGYSKARDLVHAIEKGRQLGVSIGASVIKAGMEWAEEIGKSVYTYFELALKEISVTGTAAYQYSWINQVTKSLDRNALLMPQPEELKKSATVEVQDPTKVETPAAPAEGPTEQIEVETKVENTTVKPAEQAEATPEHAAESAENADAQAPVQEVKAPEVTTDPVAPANDASKPSEETQKSQYLGDWAESDATTSVLYSLSERLMWTIGDVMADDKATADERTQKVDAILAEFHAIVLRVATALVNGTSTQKAADAAKALKEDRKVAQESLTKSLSERTTELDAVKKSLAETKEMVAAEQAKHAAVAKTLETAQAELGETKTKLETAAQSIVAKEGRKARVYSPFGALQWEEPETKPEAKKSVRDAWMADLGLAVEKNAQEAH